MALSIAALALALTTTVAAAVEAPQPKPGLWEQHVQLASDGRGGDRSSTARTCMEASVMAQTRQISAEYNRKNCSRNETRQDGGQWTVDLVCKVGASTMSGHEVTRFMGDDAYHTESTVAYEPPLSGQSRKHMVIDAKWMGACPAP
jgi:hypothetical protein